MLGTHPAKHKHKEEDPENRKHGPGRNNQGLASVAGLLLHQAGVEGRLEGLGITVLGGPNCLSEFVASVTKTWVCKHEKKGGHFDVASLHTCVDC